MAWHRNIGKAATSRARSATVRAPSLLRRFAKDEGAVALTEFGLISIPFFLLLFAVFEQGLLFFQQETFQTAITNASRLVYTGQASGAGMSQAQFKQAVCNQLPLFMSCSDVAVDVRPYSNFSSAQVTMPVDSTGKYDPTKTTYNIGSAGTSIVVVSGFAVEPVLFPMVSPYYSSAGMNGKVLLVSSAAFKNEPWQ
jgi:Flp pilus assembly protein TadG